MAAATAVLILALARIAFGVPLPRQALAFLLAVILAAAALLGIGLLIAALAPRARIAGAIGTMLFFPLMFFAGLWAPRATMGETLRESATTRRSAPRCRRSRTPPRAPGRAPASCW